MSERFELCDKCSAATGRCGRADDSLYAGDFGPYCEDCWEDLREDLAADVAALEARAKEDALQHLADIGQLHERIAALEAERDKRQWEDWKQIAKTAAAEMDALAKAIKRVQRIRLDLEDFDGDRRGHMAALDDAEHDAVRLANAALTEWDGIESWIIEETQRRILSALSPASAPVSVGAVMTDAEFASRCDSMLIFAGHPEDYPLRVKAAQIIARHLPAALAETEGE